MRNAAVHSSERASKRTRSCCCCSGSDTTTTLRCVCSPLSLSHKAQGKQQQQQQQRRKQQKAANNDNNNKIETTKTKTTTVARATQAHCCGGCISYTSTSYKSAAHERQALGCCPSKRTQAQRVNKSRPAKRALSKSLTSTHKRSQLCACMCAFVLMRPPRAAASVKRACPLLARAPVPDDRVTKFAVVAAAAAAAAMVAAAYSQTHTDWQHTKQQRHHMCTRRTFVQAHCLVASAILLCEKFRVHVCANQSGDVGGGFEQHYERT